ncbi:hypothetical protein [Steroidobacter sp.]|uniref:hypothetical protein n=1 Tax=Steroidobacter sp. TaxID=1978227 RepID=UPI003BEEFE3C
MQAKVITIGNAAGYREMELTVEIMENGKPRRVKLCFNADDSTYIVCAFLRAQALAWNNHVPLDAEPHEKARPRWVPLYGSM